MKCIPIHKIQPCEWTGPFGQPILGFMNYIGSKRRLSSFLLKTISDVAGSLSQQSFCDLFAGTGIVGQTFKPLVSHVIANDLEPYSYVLNRHYIGNTSLPDAADWIDALNDLPGKQGFIYQHYCLGSGSERCYFSDENGQKIDAIRSQIEGWKQSGEINEARYYFLLAHEDIMLILVVERLDQLLQIVKQSKKKE